MSRIIKRWPLSPTHEIIWMGFVGMGLTAVEESCVDLQQSLYHIWTQTFPFDSFSMETQAVIKSILSAIVMVRSVTVHLYFFAYFAMLLMAIFEEVPFLALPWLAVSLIRNFLLDMLAFLSGFFVCIRYALAPVCYEFIVYKLCEMGVSVYLWLSVLKLCQDISFPDISPGELVLMRAECVPRRPKEQEVVQEVTDEEEEEETGEDEEFDELPELLDGDETEDEGIQVSTLSRDYLIEEARKLGYTAELDLGPREEDDSEITESEDEEVQVNTITDAFLDKASEKQGICCDAQPEAVDTEDEDVKICTRSEEILDEASKGQTEIPPLVQQMSKEIKPNQSEAFVIETQKKAETHDDQKSMDGVDETDGMMSEGTQADTLTKEYLDQAEVCSCVEKLSVEIQVNTVSSTFLNKEAEKIASAGTSGQPSLTVI